MVTVLVALAIWAGAAHLGGSAGNAIANKERIMEIVVQTELDVGRRFSEDQYPGMKFHNDEGDAWRHAEWSKRVRDEFGPGTSCAAGFGHELENLWEQITNGRFPFLDEMLMDIHNNLTGIISSKNTDELLKKNRLFVLDPYVVK